MKSIIQEATSIAKAVELGWDEAGNPQKFSIKVLEKPEKNFIGFTTRSAKIAFYFDEEKKERAITQKFYTPKTGRRRPQKRDVSFEREEETGRLKTSRATTSSFQSSIKKNSFGSWNNELISGVVKWFNKALKEMKCDDILFRTNAQNFYLYITLNKTILDDPVRERHMLASLSTLMLAAIKKEFKKALRGHKIILTHEK